MKKLLIPTLLSILALAMGYLIGGWRAGRIATEQAYHSDLTFQLAVIQHLNENEIEEAKAVSRHAIHGALNVLNTFEDNPTSSLAFILPGSGILLDHESMDSIRSQASLTIGEEAAAASSIQ
jgi:hypothetical protein